MTVDVYTRFDSTEPVLSEDNTKLTVGILSTSEGDYEISYQMSRGGALPGWLQRANPTKVATVAERLLQQVFTEDNNITLQKDQPTIISQTGIKSGEVFTASEDIDLDQPDEIKTAILDRDEASDTPDLTPQQIWFYVFNPYKSQDAAKLVAKPIMPDLQATQKEEGES